ncbi:MAG: fatty acid desaturase [Methylococcaceae bacterium]|nr:fatty acid desaturase [Prolixibacteraceae bacterium]
MGLFIAGLIIFAWLGHLTWLLAYSEVSITSPILLVYIPVQMYLYTGLFITAHDAMHGLVSGNRKINNIIGNLSTLLFAALPYSRLVGKHKLHHLNPGEAGDPDFCTTSQNFWKWWFSFLKNYITWQQIVILAIVFNILQIWVDQWKLLLFWILPSILSTFQLFYFGTYRPHQLPHHQSMMPHRARTQRGPHWWAMLSCYFFGYHFEHHASPRTPWWKLYQIKNRYSH